MANFPNQQLTDLGWDAISEGLTGRKLLFDRVMAGQGFLPPGQDPDDLSQFTNLVDYVMDLQIAGMTADGHGRATIYATLMSRDVPVGFFLRELGVTCTVGEAPDPVDPQVLYSICNADDQATYVPAADEASKMVLGVEIHIIVGKATNIDVTITAGTIRAINLGDRIDPNTNLINPSVFAQQTGLVMEFRRLRADGSIKLAERTDYVEIGGGLPLPSPGEPGGPDDGGPIDPDTTLAGLVPVGTILPYGADAAPAGYHMCHGAEISKTTYARLYSIIGDRFNVGNAPTDPVNNFRLPLSQGRVVMGFDGVAPVGTMGGVASVVLAIAHMPSHDHNGGLGYGGTARNHHHFWADTTGGVGSHSHGDFGHGHADAGHQHAYVSFAPPATGGVPSVPLTLPPRPALTDIGYAAIQAGFANLAPAGISGATTDISSGTLFIDVNAQGGNAAHENRQPYIVVNYIIKF